MNRTADNGAALRPELDALRAVAALLVVLFHATPLFPPAATGLLEVMVRFDVGVEVFFVLSGFLIFRPFAAGTDRFEALAASICYQQLAGRAAATIWGRVRAAVTAATEGSFSPEGVLTVGEEGLRAAGCSRAKALAILDLADRVVRGAVRLGRIGALDDRAIIDHLTMVRGIGPWTAQMFLLFDLRRLDVWPTGDYGVRAGFARAFELPAMPTERDMAGLGEPFTPYRSVLAWWCWRECDSAGPESA